MRYARRFVIAGFLVALTTSCTAGRAPASGTDNEPRSSSTRLINADLINSGERTLFDAIDRLRPRWLRVRSTTSIQGPAPILVYRDNVRAGGIEVLQSILLEAVQEVRFVNATDATTRWGMGVSSGVIEIVSRRIRRL